MTQPILSQDLLRTMFDYRDDGHLIRRVTRGGCEKGGVAGTVCKRGYRYIAINGAKYSAHRLIFLWHHGWLPTGDVDHKDLDKRNCKIENLRAADGAKNQHNRGLSRNNKSGVKGVCWDTSKGKWLAQCCVNRHNYVLGRFDNIKDAEAAVRAFREQHHGEFANHGD